MPLLWKQPYTLASAPVDLKHGEHVFQVRFTEEIFRDYEQYIQKINLYRQRVWTCKATGKSNVTYEEALISEMQANKKIQHFPEEFVGPVLHMIQFNEARLEELVDLIHKNIRDIYVEGEEIGGWKDGDMYRCKILSVKERGTDDVLYEVGWMDAENGKILETSVETSENLMRKKHPLSKGMLKAFIRESAVMGPSRNSPWVIKEELARQYDIPTDPPEILREALERRDRTKLDSHEFTAEEDKQSRKNRKKKSWGKDMEVMEQPVPSTKKKRQKKVPEPEEIKPRRPPPIRYPIEDTLVQPAADDPLFTERPKPSIESVVPSCSWGDLLMVWDFCSTYCRSLRLSPFALDDLEKAVDFRESEVPLLAEAHTALLKTALSDPDLAIKFAKRGKRGTAVSSESWQDDLHDWIERGGPSELRQHLPALEQQQYPELDTHVKLQMLRELVEVAAGTEVVRLAVDQMNEGYQAALVQLREEGVEERLRLREEGLAVPDRAREEGGPDDDDSCEEKVQANGLDGKEWRRRSHNGFTKGFKENISQRVGNGVALQEITAEEEDVSMGDGHEELLKSWCKKGRRRSNGVPSSRDFTTSPALETDSRASEELEGESRSQMRQVQLQRAAEQRAVEEEERRYSRRAEQKASAERRREAQVGMAERKRMEHERLQHHRRIDQFERERERCIVRTLSLGSDRESNRYWFFRREGRVFVESKDATSWGFYASIEEVNNLLGSLNPKGIRERALRKQLEKQLPHISGAIQKRAKELAQRAAMEEAAVRRSSRVRSVPRAAPFMAYTNKYS